MTKDDRKSYFNWRLDKLLLLDLLAEGGIKEERSGTVVDQPGRLLEGLQVCPLCKWPQLEQLQSETERAPVEKVGSLELKKQIAHYTSNSNIESHKQKPTLCSCHFKSFQSLCTISASK